jgi:hypothetical protein
VTVPRGDPENLGGGLGVQVEEHAQRDHLALAGRQPSQRGEDSGVKAPGRIGERGNIMAGQRDFAAAGPPPRHACVQR